MNTIYANYELTMSDFRKASYFGLFLRHRLPLRIMFIVLLISLLYSIAAAAGFGSANPLVFFIAAGYLGWGLLLFAQTELNILRYIRSPQSLIDSHCSCTVDRSSFHLRISDHAVDVRQPLSQLTCAFELSHLFLFYISAQDVYLLPKRSLKAQEITALRQLLRRKLGVNFGSRFDKAVAMRL